MRGAHFINPAPATKYKRPDSSFVWPFVFCSAQKNIFSHHTHQQTKKMHQIVKYFSGAHRALQLCASKNIVF